jgi:hypothetical protein
MVVSLLMFGPLLFWDQLIARYSLAMIWSFSFTFIILLDIS